MPNLKAAEQFEKEHLDGVFSRAMFGALLHRFTACVGAVTLTWATVVLMGGFASQVAISDFVQVTFLVVQIACLLGLALLSSKLVTMKSLYRGSLDPVYLCYQDKRLSIITVIQCISILVQFFVFILPCAFIALSSLQREDLKAVHIKPLLFPASWVHRGFANSTSISVSDLQVCLHKCASTSHHAGKDNTTITSISNCITSCFPGEATAMVDNLQVCLYIFFCLVLVTCILAFFCLAYIAAECSLIRRKPELSLKKYHDEVMSRALNVGLVEANDFDAREFFLRGLAEDLAIRNIAPLEVKKQNSELINYLYNHPKGVEMVNEGLASEDTIRQQTAANIVGFWARRQNMEKNTVLLCKLAEKLGLPGKTAEAAANCFSALAVEWHDREESPLLKIKIAGGHGGCNVVEKVVDLVLRRRLPTLQVYVRLLDSFFMSRSVRNWLASNKPQDLEDMKAKLLSIVEQERGVQRSGGRRTGATNASIDASIRARTGFFALSAMDRLMDFENAASSNATADNPQGSTNTLNASSKNSQGTADHSNNVVISDASTGTGDTNGASSNPHSTTNHINHGTVIKDTSTRPGDDWHTQARLLLSTLDEKLKLQEFMWCTEADRYRELCHKFPGDTTLGTWLNSCEIRGREYENLP